MSYPDLTADVSKMWWELLSPDAKEAVLLDAKPSEDADALYIMEELRTANPSDMKRFFATHQKMLLTLGETRLARLLAWILHSNGDSRGIVWLDLIADEDESDDDGSQSSGRNSISKKLIARMILIATGIQGLGSKRTINGQIAVNTHRAVKLGVETYENGMSLGGSGGL